MDSWIPLISACIGGLIATIPLLLGLIVQIYIHVSEMRQKAREAKIQAIEKSLGGDIDKAMDLLAEMIKIFSQRRNCEFRREALELQVERKIMSEEDFPGEIKSLVEVIITQNQQVKTVLNTMSGLMYSFDGNISHEYRSLIELIIPLYSVEKQQSNEAFAHLILKSGNLQRILREKKISIRDAIK